MVVGAAGRRGRRGGARAGRGGSASSRSLPCVSSRKQQRGSCYRAALR
jgi:hypothetical protein